MDKYDHKRIEKKWQNKWEQEGVFAARDNDPSSRERRDDPRPKFYGLIEFPYPSGDGLHVGHLRPNTAMDIIARKRRMEGFNVLYPIGFDSFGLPTENYAIKTGRPPAEITRENIANFTKQLKMMGFSFDWDRQVTTSDPAYYKWTQWIFLQFFKHGLAYKKKMAINWCPSCKIGLANEEVVDGSCERCGTPVEKREKEQWMLAITKYANKLLEGLNEVDYIDRAKVQQENWIGRKEGINIEYQVVGSDKKVVCFTTRPDTNFGATFVVLGPEHPLAFELSSVEHKKEVQEYIASTKKTAEAERLAEGREKTGVFTGECCVNNLNGEKMPIWISDYVLGHVGTGAVVGVPGHDLRDFEFAKKFGIPIKRVVVGSDKDTSPITKKEQVQEEKGTMMNSGFLDGMDIHAATKKVMDYLEEKGWGKRVVNYKLRDWVFSRQRYWGEPIPLVWCEKCNEWVPLPEDQLPLELPKVEKYQPTDTGESPLAAITDWVKTVCPKCGGPARRETDTMPNWAGSSWYFLRYCDPENKKEFASMEKLKYWMGPVRSSDQIGLSPTTGTGLSPTVGLSPERDSGGVDWYNGGMEHTVLHLLYSRFWNQFLYDIGLVPCREPYKKRTSHGLILAEDGEKMSKSRGNVVNPNEIVEQYGADVLRVYEMFMGPFDQPVPWSTKSIAGVARFLERVWNLQERVSLVRHSEEPKATKNPLHKSTGSFAAAQDDEVLRLVHKTIKKVTEDIEQMKYNTAIAAMMTLVNELSRQTTVDSLQYEALLKLLYPFAPHICEEIYEKLCSARIYPRPSDAKASHYESGSGLLCQQPWPTWNPALVKDEEIELVVQVNGRVRDRLRVAADISEQEAKAAARASEKVQKWIDGQKVKDMVFVKGKLVNIVT